jgi:transcriptional regulator with XRE-family HTH domain
MLGEKLRSFRESKGLLQRQVAAKLDVDTAYISKIESEEKIVSRSHLKSLAKLFNISEDELLTYWLADKVYNVVKGEGAALEAIGLIGHKLESTNNFKVSKKKN